MSEKTLGNVSPVAKLAVGMAVFQVLTAVWAFLGESFDNALILVAFAVVGIVALGVTGVAWDAESVLKRPVRIAFVALPLAPALIGLLCAVSTGVFGLPTDHPLNLSMSGSGSPFLYTLGFDMALTLSYAQVIVMFLLPAMVSAAVVGDLSDARRLKLLSLLNLVLMTLSVFVFSQHYAVLTWNTVNEYAPVWEFGSMEISLVQIVMLAVTSIFTVISLFVSNKTKKGAA